MEDVKSICVNISEMVRIAEDYMLDIDHEDRTQVHIYGCWNKEAAVCVSYKG